MRDYATIRALKRGETVELEGMKFRKIEGEIEPGDWYIAERNQPAQLLTCRENVSDKSFIVPAETAYCFDTTECVRVEMIDE